MAFTTGTGCSAAYGGTEFDRVNFQIMHSSWIKTIQAFVIILRMIGPIHSPDLSSLKTQNLLLSHMHCLHSSVTILDISSYHDVLTSYCNTLG